MMAQLGPSTLVYFVPLQRDATGFPVRVPERTPITLEQASARLKSQPYAWVIAVDDTSEILTPWAIEKALALPHRCPDEAESLTRSKFQPFQIINGNVRYRE